MPRALFEKTGNAVWISHLDLMRVFQRAFKRAGLPLTHTQGYNPRPSVSIALPLSVGVESRCELLDFDLDGVTVSCDEIKERLNKALVDGVRVLSVYEDGRKLKELGLMHCSVELEYDALIDGAGEAQIRELFHRERLIVDKKGKNGIVEQDIIPIISSLDAALLDEGGFELDGAICCQDPTLNPAQMVVAIERYLPQYEPDHFTCCRIELYDRNETVFR